MEKDLEMIIDELGIDKNITLEDLPNIDLYMDQVIQLFENKLNTTKRNEEDKILTKTMINNYAKGKLFIPVKNKKYSKEHLMLISLIYQLKGSLSISDIKTVLGGLNDKVIHDNFPIELFYDSYLQIANENVITFKEDLKERVEDTKKEIIKMDDQDTDYLEKVLLIASLINMSNLYRRTAEKIVDQLVEDEK